MHAIQVSMNAAARCWGQSSSSRQSRPSAPLPPLHRATPANKCIAWCFGLWLQPSNPPLELLKTAVSVKAKSLLWETPNLPRHLAASFITLFYS